MNASATLTQRRKINTIITSIIGATLFRLLFNELTTKDRLSENDNFKNNYKLWTSL